MAALSRDQADMSLTWIIGAFPSPGQDMALFAPGLFYAGLGRNCGFLPICGSKPTA
jgi:hypothetical protein